MDVVTAAKFPFLKEASAILKEKGVTLEQLVSGVAYERARYQGRQRVEEAIYDKYIDDHALTSQTDAMVELLSYPVARMIVSAVADPAVVRRYAIAEGKKANDRLSSADLGFILKVATELQLNAKQEDGGFSVDFADFLRFSATMRDKTWKLVNQKLKGGRVQVTRYRLVRMIEQVITDKISAELPLAVNDEILEKFAPTIEEIRESVRREMEERRQQGFGRLSIVRTPPCMRKLLEMTRAGENVPHSGRFALVAFLHTLGMDSNDIIETFATSPDFDERKSRYQVDHITGVISGTEYTPPECSTMKSYGICFNPDDLCKRIRHPLSYYKLKGKLLRSGK